MKRRQFSLQLAGTAAALATVPMTPWAQAGAPVEGQHGAAEPGAGAFAGAFRGGSHGDTALVVGADPLPGRTRPPTTVRLRSP